MKIKILIIILASTLLSSCAYLFNGLVLPNECKKCKIIDKFTNESVWSDEGCGSAMTHLEEDAKVKAYDMNAASYMERYEVSCDTWTDSK
jgi:hypothetical protein